MCYQMDSPILLNRVLHAIRQDTGQYLSFQSQTAGIGLLKGVKGVHGITDRLIWEIDRCQDEPYLYSYVLNATSILYSQLRTRFTRIHRALGCRHYSFGVRFTLRVTDRRWIRWADFLLRRA